MTSSEVRLAETIEIFFQAADLSSDGAMAGHAYKRAVDELDTGVGRDLVSRLSEAELGEREGEG